CQGPSISLPRAQYLTLYGSGCPFFRRSSAQYVALVPLVYSTQCRASSMVPRPRLMQMYGSALMSPVDLRHSSVPKRFDSTSFEASWGRAGRLSLGPMPSFQL